MRILIEIQYLPSIAYFASLDNSTEIILEKHEHFVKQSYRNRCQIVSSQGFQNLIIPVSTNRGKVLISDVRIDYRQKWVNNHWRAIQSSYGKAPFYEHYRDDLYAALNKKTELLYDLNLDLLSMCLKWLNKTVTIKESLAYVPRPAKEILDLRSVVSVKNGQNMHFLYKPVPYTQVFGSSFAANASIIDLIFCKGPEAARIVKASAAVNEQM